MSPEQFQLPTKIHFVSPDGEDVGSVFSDSLVTHPGGTSFHFGMACVATIDSDCLLIGPRKIDRSVLRTVRPFWWEAEGSGLSGIEPLLGPSLRVIEQEAV